MKRILVVDDDKASCELLREIFGAQGWATETATTPEAALALAAQAGFDLVVSDINLEAEQSGLDILRSLRGACPVILVTGFGTLDAAVEASREGAWDFISKPFKVGEVVATARRALERGRAGPPGAETEAAEKLSSRYESAGLVGRAPVMIELYKEIARVAPSRSTVLVVGESGTGKELVARSVHKHSPRAARAFVPVNCGAFTETLLESELFGYTRGAFTGATANRKGLFEAADRGTIFLDEIGEMSPTMQVKLLRVLQERKVRPVGAHEETGVDTRVIAATNRDLASMVKQGSFREDLFYRVSVIPIELPPLRERREDIPELVEHFVEKFCRQTGRQLRVSERARELLEGYSWPGNVRELEHTIERAVALERTDAIQPESLPQSVTNYNPASVSPSETGLPDEGLNLVAHLEHLEKTYLLEALRRTGGNQTRAAEILHLSVRSLRHLLDKHGIRSVTAQLRSDAAGRGASEG